MTVMYEPARLNTTGSLYTPPVTHEMGSTGERVTVQAAPGRSVYRSA